MTEPIRTILITGAGSGLGRGLSQHLARRGHLLVVTDRNFRGAQETASAIESEGGRSIAYALDVTSEREVQQLFQSLGDCRVDVLINNAGLQHVARLEEFPVEEWSRLVDVMLKGTAWMTRAVLPRMRLHGFGRIINIGSIHSLVGSPFKSAYVAAKHGLIGFARVIALETGDGDITINTICPSYIRTPLVDAQIASQARAHGISEEEVIQRIMLEPMPKKAFITIEEVAAAVEYLMSAAARNVTGQTLVIDGGWTCH